jgi:hypothetical protein
MERSRLQRCSLVSQATPFKKKVAGSGLVNLPVRPVMLIGTVLPGFRLTFGRIGASETMAPVWLALIPLALTID